MINLDPARLPSHVAVIMDGNGRWAERRGLPRVEGHRAGADSVRAVVEATRELSIPWLTLYAFSEENWQRPRSEVKALMDLLIDYLRGERPNMLENGIRLQTLGETDRLPGSVRKELAACQKATAAGRDMTVCLALSYAGRTEIVRAARALAELCRDKKMKPRDIGPDQFAARLYTAGVPDPDFLIRTSGEMRISNFLLWQLAYAEFYFTPTLWPDFRKTELHIALNEYQGRQRRFGLTAAQIEAEKGRGA
jgi:undecaprenyl diphosphate synthase